MEFLITFLIILFWAFPFLCNNSYFIVEERWDGKKYDWKHILLSIIPILNIWTLFKYKTYDGLFD